MLNRYVYVLSLSICLMASLYGQEKKPAAPAKQPRRMWADNLLWTDAPRLEFAKWLSKKPDMKGKFVLIEFWRSWCGACKRATPKMNALQKKFGKDLVVIAVTGEKEEVVKAYKGPKMEHFLALDKPRPAEAKEDEDQKQEATEEAEEGPVAVDPKSFRKEEKGAFEAHFGVWGWPHAVLLEPEHRCVVWEGYPDLKGYELTEKKIAKYIAVHKKSATKGKAPSKKPASK